MNIITRNHFEFTRVETSNKFSLKLNKSNAKCCLKKFKIVLIYVPLEEKKKTKTQGSRSV